MSGNLGTNVSKKAKISQDELRRMMNITKYKTPKVSTAKAIDSPLARSMKDGTVICILCNAIINQRLSWSDHISTKSHRDKVFAAKEKKLISIELRPGKEIGDLKRSIDSSLKDPIPVKKPKGILKNAPPLPPSKISFEASDVRPSGSNKKTIGSSLVQYDSEEEGSGDEAERKPTSNTPKIVPSSSSSVFTSRKGDTVPEGFFDDPVMDAKARNLEYKDPIEEEWERFQKEMKEETSTSAQIIAEDQEEATVERTIEEMDEQLRRWGRVMDLVRKKEEVQIAERTAMEENDEDMPDDLEDFNEFLDWRSKKSYR